MHAPDGDRLYVVGGTSGGDFLADAWLARIEPDGTLNGWVTTARLPEPRAGMGVYAGEHAAILVGGKAKRAKEQTRDVFVADLASDGSLDAWRPAPPLPEPRFHLTATRAGDHLYAIGGLDDAMTSTRSVFRAKLDHGDTLSTWTEDRALPDTRSHHAAFAWKDYVFVAGGIRGNPTDDATVTTLKDVLRARVGADGALGPWEHAGDLDAPLATHAAVVVGDHVYVAGGLQDDVVATVRRARIESDGRIGAWQLATPMPHARAHMQQTPVLGGFLYVTGGNGGRHKAIDDVSFGKLP
jgi:N-acetylneuraminic acid mutarotase